MKPRKFDDEHKKIKMQVILVLPPNYRFESMQYLTNRIMEKGEETISKDEETDGIPGTDIVLL